MPWSRRWRMWFSTSATWRTEIAAVGSSISTILASASMVRAIATAWRWPPDICLTRSRGRVSDFSSLEELAGAAVHGAVVEDRTGPILAAHLAAEEDVGGGGEVVAEREVLVDDLDAVAAGVERPVQDDLAAVHPHAARGWAEVAGDHLDQGRLAGAVVAHQPDDLAGLERERHVIHRLDGAEVLGNVGELENSHPSSSSRGAARAYPRRPASPGRRRPGFSRTPGRPSIAAAERCRGAIRPVAQDSRPGGFYSQRAVDAKGLVSVRVAPGGAFCGQMPGVRPGRRAERLLVCNGRT